MAPAWYRRLDPVTRSFLESLEAGGWRPVHEMTVEELRLEDAGAAAASVPKPACEVDDRVEPLLVAGEVRDVAMRLVRAPGPAAADASAAVLYLHGGGWVSCDADVYDRLVRELAVRTGATIVFVEYSRAPEAPYPVAIEEGLAVLSWLAGRGAEVNVDPGRIGIAGDSAGGNLAAAVTIAASSRGMALPRCQALWCPVTDASEDWPSFRAFDGGAIAGPKDMAWFWDRYVPDHGRRSEPTASPLQASMEQLAGLPPALVITAEFDILRDQGEAYASNLLEAGVPVVAARYLGTIHAFMTYDELAGSAVSAAAMDQISAFLRRELGGGGTTVHEG